MQPVGGSISSLMTRYLYSATDSGKSWDSPVDLLVRPEVLQDLHFWENNINSLNVKKLFEYLKDPRKNSRKTLNGFLTYTNSVW